MIGNLTLQKLELDCSKLVQSFFIDLEDEESEFLCVLRGGFKYVVDLRIFIEPDRTMPPNCTYKNKPACLYVDPGVRRVVPVDELDELYLIKATS